MNLTASESKMKKKKLKQLLTFGKFAKNVSKHFGSKSVRADLNIAFLAHIIPLLLIFPFGNLFSVDLVDGISEENKSQCFEN